MTEPLLSTRPLLERNVANVKITDVEAVYLRLDSFDENRSDSSRDALLVFVHTDAGVTGVGEVDSNPVVAKAAIDAPSSHTISRGLRQILIGRSPFDSSALWDEMYRGTLYHGRGGAVIHAMAGIDIALWDLKGKLLGLPVATLLGGARRDRVLAYSSNMFQFSVADNRARAERALAAGFRAVKFGWEPFGESAAGDVQLVSTIRETVGPDVLVAIDAGLAFDAHTALSRARLLERFDLLWLEEPLPPDHYSAYGRLTAHSPIPIAAGEEESTREGFARLLKEGGVHVAQVDVTRVGLTKAIEVAGDAAALGVPVANHTFTTDINATASLHMLAAVSNAKIFEYGVEPNDISRNLLTKPLKLENGEAVLPGGPGLGIEVDFDVVERYRWPR